MGKLLESHAIHQLAPRVCGRGRGSGAVCDGGVRRGGGPPAHTVSEQSCLWCAEKGNNIFDSPCPSSPDLKKVHDDLIAKRDAKGRNEHHKACRLATASTSAIVSDDESDEADDLAQKTYTAIQSCCTANEPTKPSCPRILSQASLDPSTASPLPLALRQKVVRHVSIAADSQACPVPSYCLLPAFVAVAKALSRFFNFRPIMSTKITMTTLYVMRLVMRLFLRFGFPKLSREPSSLTLAQHVQLPIILLKYLRFVHLVCSI